MDSGPAMRAVYADLNSPFPTEADSRTRPSLLRRPYRTSHTPNTAYLTPLRPPFTPTQRTPLRGTHYDSYNSLSSFPYSSSTFTSPLSTPTSFVVRHHHQEDELDRAARYSIKTLFFGLFVSCTILLLGSCWVAAKTWEGRMQPWNAEAVMDRSGDVTLQHETRARATTGLDPSPIYGILTGYADSILSVFETEVDEGAGDKGEGDDDGMGHGQGSRVFIPPSQNELLVSPNITEPPSRPRVQVLSSKSEHRRRRGPLVTMIRRRPSSFGPHIESEQGLSGFLIPMEQLYPSPTTSPNPSDPRRACFPPHPLSSNDSGFDSTARGRRPEKDWLALVERGTCSFVDKVRLAQKLGAGAVVVGDFAGDGGTDGGDGGIGGGGEKGRGGDDLLVERGLKSWFKSWFWDLWGDDETGDGIGKEIGRWSGGLGLDLDFDLGGGIGGGLITMWGPGDTSDINISSSFVSRESYLELLKLWHERIEPGSVQGSENVLRGLDIVLGKDEIWSWPLMDLLLLLLFLPSILTVFTLILHRIRVIQQQRKERAPKDAVERLEVIIWEEGDGRLEKEEHAGPEIIRHDEDTVGDEGEDGTQVSAEGKDDLDGLRGSGWLGKAKRKASQAWQTTMERVRSLRSFYPFSSFSSSDLEASNDEASPLPKPKSKKAKRARLFGQTECAICICEFVPGDRVRILPCFHGFHQDEIDGWLLNNRRVCPICRYSITDPPLSGPHSTPPTPSPAGPFSPSSLHAAFPSGATATLISPLPVPAASNPHLRNLDGAVPGPGPSSSLHSHSHAHLQQPHFSSQSPSSSRSPVTGNGAGVASSSSVTLDDDPSLPELVEGRKRQLGADAHAGFRSLRRPRSRSQSGLQKATSKEVAGEDGGGKGGEDDDDRSGEGNERTPLLG